MIERAIRPQRLALLVGGEGFAAACGLLTTLRLARVLSLDRFGSLEFASALVAWWLILVRGGYDTLLIREAARRPMRLRHWSALLILGRLLWAVVSWSIVVLIGNLADQSANCASLGALLFVSAISPDLKARVEGRTNLMGLAALARGAMTLLWSILLVDRDSSVVTATLGFVLGEAVAALVFACSGGSRLRLPSYLFGSVRQVWYWSGRSLPFLGWRFARVTLYALDLVLLGLCHDEDLGVYASARRLTFACLGLALIVPASIAGPLASAFARSAGQARKTIDDAATSLLWLTLPPTLGLLLTAQGWMPLLFGPALINRDRWLSLLILRVPVLALSALFQSALVASGRENQALRQGLGLLFLALISASVAWLGAGAWGVGWTMLGVELLGLALGWHALGAQGVEPGLEIVPRSLTVGLVGMVAGCVLTAGSPVIVQSATGAAGFGLGILSLFGMRRGRLVSEQST